MGAKKNKGKKTVAPAEPLKKTIYQLALHEGLTIRQVPKSTMTVLRVPGGWIYTLGIEDDTKSLSLVSTFVPFHKEFN